MSGGYFGELEVGVRATIRACRKDDLPALEWMGLFAPHRDIIREAYEEQESDRGMMVLAVSAGFPIAQIWIRFHRDEPRSRATLWAVRTFYPLQGAGIGRRMMRVAEHILAERGIAHAELEVDRSNQAALDFYHQLGWRTPPPGSGSRETARSPARLLLTKDIAAQSRP